MTETAPKPPPNLRVSDDEEKECDSCSHYERGKCSMYNHLPVDGEWVCDSFEPKDKEKFDGKNLREAENEAYVRVKAHVRRRRSESNSGEPDADDNVK